LPALYLSIARFFIFYVPLAYVGSLHFGLLGFFGGAVFGNFLMALISWRTFNRAICGEHQLLEKTAETT
jgi:Na+-driven multidrug efflux pump